MSRSLAERNASIKAGLELHLDWMERLATAPKLKYKQRPSKAPWERPIEVNDFFEAARKQMEAEQEDQAGEANATERRNFADRRRLAMRHADLRDGYAVRGQTRNEIEGQGPVHSKRQPRYDDLTE